MLIGTALATYASTTVPKRLDSPSQLSKGHHSPCAAWFDLFNRTLKGSKPLPAFQILIEKLPYCCLNFRRIKKLSPMSRTFHHFVLHGHSRLP